jgi:hypothetical protein
MTGGVERNPEPRPGDRWSMTMRGLEGTVFEIVEVLPGRVRFTGNISLAISTLVERTDVWKLVRRAS